MGSSPIFGFEMHREMVNDHLFLTLSCYEVMGKQCQRVGNIRFDRKVRDWIMHASVKLQKKEKKAMNTSLYGGILFVVLELFMFFVTHSQAVLLDAIYDGVEMVMLIISVTIIPLLYRSSNEKHPFGYLQVESLFVVIKGFMMTSVTLGLIINNLEIALQGGRQIAFEQIAYFELFALVLSIVILIVLKRYDKKINSPLVTLEIQEWSIDAVASLGMAVAFFLPGIISHPRFQSLTPYLDQIIAIVLSLFMLPMPIKSVITGLRDLFLMAPEEETVNEVKEIITPILNEYGYEKLYYDILRTGRKLWISVYITFDRDMVSISRFGKVQEKVIQQLRVHYQDFYFELLPDIEYKDTNRKI